MKHKVVVSLLSSVLTCVVLLLIVANVGAQGPDRGTPQSINPEVLTGTPFSSTFTYQGQLKSGGSAVSGSCDFQFGLWDAASGGVQVGVTQTLSAVNVVNGLFTVPLNFGATAFIGDARWLSMAVRCPAGSGAYAPLDPRQAVTPAPYALALPGLWTQPGASVPSIIGGYVGNAVKGTADGSVIAGGGGVSSANIISGTNVAWATIGGGSNNQISGITAFSVIDGGRSNQISGNTGYSAIGGGLSNQISGTTSASVIGGGYTNQIGGTAAYSAIGGGQANQIGEGASYSTIGGGYTNHINGTATASVINSGWINQIGGSASYSAIGSGINNQISGTATGSAIGSGASNVISGTAYYSAIGSGQSNLISGNAYRSAIGGGDTNQIGGGANGSAIGGGGGNQISGTAKYSAIGSGEANRIDGIADHSAISGGAANQISGSAWWGTIGGGSGNQLGGSAYRSVIGGGNTNVISGTANTSVIGGGLTNKISGNAYNSTISGGNTNQIGGNAGNAAIGGGASNVISGTNTGQSVISGGGFNTISGTTATIPGGYGNTATGDYSFAAGTQAKANHAGAFVWGDNTLADFASTGNNQFLIRAGGGVGIGTNVPGAQLDVASGGSLQLRLNQTNVNDYARLEMTAGGAPSQSWDVAANGTTFTFYSGSAGQNALTLTPNDPTDYMMMGNGAHLTHGGVWTNVSDRNAKANFALVDGRAVLDKVLSLPISTWNYKAEDAATRHLGPMAQDFYAAFGLGSDDKSIGTVDEEGVALAAIQGLYQVVAEKDQRITQLEDEVAQLKTDQPVSPFNLISPLVSIIALGGVIVIGLKQKRGGRS